MVVTIYRGSTASPTILDISRREPPKELEELLAERDHAEMKTMNRRAGLERARKCLK